MRRLPSPRKFQRCFSIRSAGLSLCSLVLVFVGCDDGSSETPTDLKNSSAGVGGAVDPTGTGGNEPSNPSETGGGGNSPGVGGNPTTGGTRPTESCGNGSIDEDEECDGSNLNGKDCNALGFESGELACNSSCRLDSSGCEEGGTLVTEMRTLCSDQCGGFTNDGDCHDGGDGGFRGCDLGKDCSDCGPREAEVPVVSGTGRAACGQATYGAEEGDPAENWTTFNQHGAAISLSNFCGKWVYIEMGALWCPSCASHAPKLEEMANNLKDFRDGLVVVQSFYENLNPIEPNLTDIPSVDELRVWTEEYGQVEVHAICDANYELWTRFRPLDEKNNPPDGILINPDGVIDRVGQTPEFFVQRRMENWP